MKKNVLVMWKNWKPPIHCLWECKLVQPYGKVWQFFRRLNVELTYDPAIPLVVTYPREMKTSLHKLIYRYS